MKIHALYVYPTLARQRYRLLAERFVSTWQDHPPGREPLSLTIACNGPALSPIDEKLFEPLNPRYVSLDNRGWDIGAFQWAAENLRCDLLLCLGACVHFHQAGWGDRMVESWVQHGPHLYGCWGFYHPNWHIRTTAFWCPPELLQSYPAHVGSDRRARYEFEHGQESFTRHVRAMGFETFMVSWSGVYRFDQWGDHVPGLKESLLWDQFTNQGKEPRRAL